LTNHKIYKVGIYARLSKENAKDEESLSIEKVIYKHVGELSWLTQKYGVKIDEK